jgi:hypothetical protein
MDVDYVECSRITCDESLNFESHFLNAASSPISSSGSLLPSLPPVRLVLPLVRDRASTAALLAAATVPLEFICGALGYSTQSGKLWCASDTMR